MSDQRKGVVLGIFEGEKAEDWSLTKAGRGFKTKENATENQLQTLIEQSGLTKKKGKSRIFYGLDGDYGTVAVVNLGKKDVGFDELEDREQGRENIRNAVGEAVKQLRDVGVGQIYVDSCGDSEAAAEGAQLSVFSYDDLKCKDKKKDPVVLDCFTDSVDEDSKSSVKKNWDRGIVLAEGQNFARMLMEAPSNKMTPTIFSEIAKEKLGKLKNVTVTVRDKAWAESMKMGAFLGVSQGSEEPLRFVHVDYKGGKDGEAYLAMVGKGVTFDSGGISIKASGGMEDMRADMGGAACTLASIYTAARLEVPLNIYGFMPLCDNVPSGTSYKPGDVVTAMNGTTIQVDNTDAEGRLILCDALCYAETFKPKGIVDMATLTGAIVIALGAGASGVFTNSDVFWKTMHRAGKKTGDRVWRMPLYKLYAKQIGESHLADLNNIGSAGMGARAGGSCTAAAFLKEFVTCKHWMHMDIAGVMGNKSEVPFLPPGMAGRPTRTVVEFMEGLSNKWED